MQRQGLPGSGGTPNNPAWPDHPKASAMLNLPDPPPGSSPIDNPAGKWTFGESAEAADHGGFLSWPNPNPILGVHVHRYNPPYPPFSGSAPEGWVLESSMGARYWRLRGYLRPQPLPGTPPLPVDLTGPADPTRVADAGFELITTEFHDPNARTVIVLQTPPTFVGDITSPGKGNAPDFGIKHGYGGSDSHSGLERDADAAFPTPPGGNARADVNWMGHIPLMWANQSLPQGAGRRNLVAVRILPQIVVRPTRFQIQRNLEIARAVQKMLTHFNQNGTASVWRPPTPSWQALASPSQPNGYPSDPAPFTCVIEGGSLGGAVSLWSAILFPSDFHGAVSSGACPSMRAWVGEQESHRYLGALSGFVEQSSNFSPNECLHYASAIWGVAKDYYGSTAQGGPFTQAQLDTWSPFFHVSSTRAWRDGFLKRPVYVIVADEDHISSGVEAIPWLTGNRSFVASGQATNAPSASVPYFFSVVSKCGHFADQRPFKPYLSAAPKSIPAPATSGWLGNNHLSFEEAILGFLGQAVLSRTAAPTIAFTPPMVRPAVDATQDPWDHFLQPTSPPPPAPTSPLRLDANFLGQAGLGSPVRSLIAEARRPGKSFGIGTYLSPGDAILVNEGSIYVGSAEGVVTRLTLAANNELVPQAMSESLGYGAWTLCRAQANGSAAKEIIVGTRRGLHALNSESLSTILSVRNLDWEFGNPRHLCRADVIEGGYEEVFFASEHGCIACFSADPSNGGFQEIGRYGEPGVIDMIVLGVEGPYVRLSILSERGHVLNVLWDPTGQGLPSMIVEATSPRLSGTPVDMELMGTPGSGAQLAVLCGSTIQGQLEDVMLFDAGTLAPIGTGGQHRARGWNPTATFNLSTFLPTRSTAANLAWDGVEFVGMRNGQLVRFAPAASGPTGWKDLQSYLPFTRAIGMVVGDLGPNSPAGPEVVISTESGYVGWIPLAELGSGSSSAFSWSQPPAAGSRPLAANGPHAYTNRTVAATWAIQKDPGSNTLDLVDQSGTRWRVDGAGNVTYRDDLVAFSEHVATVGSFRASASRPGPYRNMKNIGGQPTISGSGGPTVNVSGVPGPNPAIHHPISTPSNSSAIESWPYWPEESFHYLNNAGGVWRSTPATPARIMVHDGSAMFPMGGDALENPDGTLSMAWWGGDPWARLQNLITDWPNRVQGVVLGPIQAGNPPTRQILSWWTSSGRPPATSAPSTVSEASGYDLRNHGTFPFAITDAQALRMFRDPVCGEPRIALNTPGARLMILEPADPSGGPLLERSYPSSGVLDFGTGGMALATAARDNTFADIYLGAMADFADDEHFSSTSQAPPQNPNPSGADDMTSCIVRIPYQGAQTYAGAHLLTPEIYRLDGKGGRPKVYGVCGLAVVDVIASPPTAPAADEIVVGSLDGHLLVFERLPNGGIGALRYQAQVEGAVGAYNSILAHDLDGIGGNELYVATSFGLRRWVP